MFKLSTAVLNHFATIGAALVLSTLPIACASAEQEPVWVGRFNSAEEFPPAPWRIVRIRRDVAATQYAPTLVDGVAAIEAHAVNSVALLARPLDPEILRSHPILCWRWRIEATLAKADLDSRAGDDYAARVYLAFALPPAAMSWSARLQLRLARAVHGPELPDAAINYVWDNRHPEGTVKPNAYTERVVMHVLRSGNREAGQWRNERAAVLATAQEDFGKVDIRPTSLAFASDTDNTHGVARAQFADFHFVKNDAPCAFPARSRPASK